jgi:hypothetical protein
VRPKQVIYWAKFMTRNRRNVLEIFGRGAGALKYVPLYEWL